jgi:anti-sigma B factor antagonist
MEFAITEFKHCDLMKISGRIDSYTTPKINQALNALITDDRHNIVIDMKDVTYISSSGILMFVNTQRRFHRQNRGKLVFSGITNLVYSGFEISGFHQLFEFYDDVVSAVGGF